MTTELYKKYRPKSFKDVIGQDDAIRSLMDMGKRKAIPHAILLVGDSGVGKTTIARILRTKLKCSDIDFIEMNSADFTGIDTIRSIRKHMNAAPLAGPCRVWLIDEVHMLSAAGSEAFLKILEDTPKHVYFMLATTDPQKLKKTIITRCTQIKLKLLSKDDLYVVIDRVLDQETVHIKKQVTDKIAEVAEGSARKALVILHAVIGLEKVEDQLSAIEASNVAPQAIEIARNLMKTSTKWPKMQEILKNVEEEPETIRWMVLGYCKAVLLGKGDHKRAAIVIEEFREHFYDSKMTGLVISCYNVISS